ncbi:exosporium glycoprotein BclB-related protein [Clostridium sp. YIM B02551]|uniref:exosporium glycoprotein BclB-related protein n=1 Tax=Clostridium sp. YIM B02551 TaxID=2910679 RepID=UPI001EEA605A|nr:exosporium glycoprotein BclB-related protein [Clostridium sp. YIM B02551]
MSYNINFDTPKSGTSRVVQVECAIPPGNRGYFLIDFNVTNSATPSRNRSFYRTLSYDNSTGNTIQVINTSCTVLIIPKLLGSDTVNVNRAFSLQCTKTSVTIQYSSGTPVTLTSIAGGLVGLPGLIGFGTSVQGQTNLGATIDLNSYPPSVLSYVFTVLCSGTINTIDSHFSTSLALSLLLTEVQVSSRLYASTSSSNIFSFVPGSQVDLTPKLTDAVAIGTNLSKSNSVSIPVTPGTRLLMVYFITVTGVNLINSVSGYANANVLIQSG